MIDPSAVMHLPGATTGDVTTGPVAGRDVVQQGVDGGQVVELLGRRLERHLERIAGSLTLFVAVAAFQTAVLLLVAILILSIALNPQLIAGLHLEILN
jgi:hypothetical protein